MPRLLMIQSAPVIERSADEVSLDIKFVEGMKFYQENWPGAVDCIMRRGDSEIPFSENFKRNDLDFSIIAIGKDDVITSEMVSAYDMVSCAGDAHQNLNLGDLLGEVDTKLVYSIEYTIATRTQIARLDNSKALPRRVYSVIWNLLQERRRRRAFRRAHGIQANGYPAYHAYRRLNPNTMLYLDNRMKPGLFASAQQMSDRRAHLEAGGMLRLIHSGRLEPMKGAQDLIPIARRLHEGGLDFTLAIYGTGSLKQQIVGDIARHGLSQRVFAHDPVDFETELVPLCRTRADMFLSCHRQADPSCSYLESMGCGLAVAGYRNRMWAALLAESRAGWAAPLGNPAAMAEMILGLNANRDDIAERCQNALDFALSKDFHSEFKKRMDHLIATEAG